MSTCLPAAVSPALRSTAPGTYFFAGTPFNLNPKTKRGKEILAQWAARESSVLLSTEDAVELHRSTCQTTPIQALEAQTQEGQSTAQAMELSKPVTRRSLGWQE